MRPEIHIFSHSVQLKDSWCVNSRDCMREWIDEFRYDLNCPNEVFRRSERSLLREWEAHNMLFWHGYEVDRTKDVDFDAETFKREVAYFFLSLAFRLFERHQHININEPRP